MGERGWRGVRGRVLLRQQGGQPVLPGRPCGLPPRPKGIRAPPRPGGGERAAASLRFAEDGLPARRLLDLGGRGSHAGRADGPGRQEALGGSPGRRRGWRSRRRVGGIMVYLIAGLVTLVVIPAVSILMFLWGLSGVVNQFGKAEWDDDDS